MTSLTLTAREFRDLVSTVLAMASNGDLPVLNSIRVESYDGHVTAMATDRFRLGIQRMKHADAKAGAFAATIRVADVRSILALFKPARNNPGSITLTVDGLSLSVESAGSLGFDFASACVGYSLVDGDYPDLRAVLRKALEETPAAGPIGFNPAFLSSFRGAAETVVMRAGASPRSPVVLEGDDFIGLLMPRRREYGAEVAITDWGALLHDPVPATPKPAKKKKTARAEAVPA